MIMVTIMTVIAIQALINLLKNRIMTTRHITATAEIARTNPISVTGD